MAENNQKSPINVGARAIYELRGHSGKSPWGKAALETRNAYRTRMQEIVNELAKQGYEIRPKVGRR